MNWFAKHGLFLLIFSSGKRIEPHWVWNIVVYGVNLMRVPAVLFLVLIRCWHVDYQKINKILFTLCKFNYIIFCIPLYISYQFAQNSITSNMGMWWLVTVFPLCEIILLSLYTYLYTYVYLFLPVAIFHILEFCHNVPTYLPIYQSCTSTNQFISFCYQSALITYNV